MSKKVEEKVELETSDFELDMSEISAPIQETRVETPEPKAKMETRKKVAREEETPIINCLRNERIIVRHVPRLSGIWGDNPKHVLSGGMADGATRTFVVPRLSSGMFVNVLTDKEKAFLEDIMGLEYNALSIYKKKDNFWDDSTDNGINRVRLTKEDNYLNLADPEDYIRYKILLANKEFIAPSLQELEDTPKVTYQFVIISEGAETKSAKLSMSNTMKCYKEFGKIENEFDTLRVIIETIEGRPIAASTSLEFLQTRINALIQADSKLFLKVISDPLLSTKVLIRKGVEAGVISKRGNYYYTKDNTPLCLDREEPTLNIAAKYLNLPKNQELKLSIEAKTK